MTNSKTALSVLPTFVQANSDSLDLDIASNEHLDDCSEPFELRNAQEVKRFLAQYPELNSFLHKAYKRLVEIFSTQTSYALEIFIDPETTDERRLDVCILTSDDVDQAMAKLDEFDEWFIWEDVFSKGLANFSLELI